MIKNEEITLKEVIEKYKNLILYFRTKWILIGIITALGIILGLLYSKSKVPTYTATLTFALEDDKSSGGLGAVLSSQIGFDIGGGTSSAGGMFSGANLISLFKSRKMIEQTLLKPFINNGKISTLAEMYIEIKGWRKKTNLNNIEFNPNTKREDFTRSQDSLLGKIYEELILGPLSVEQNDKKVSIINIETATENELFSKYFTEALAENVSKFYIETKSRKARINFEILQKQTDSIQNVLFGSIRGVAVANDNTFNLNPALNVHMTTSAKHQVSVQANTAILTELVKQLELSKVTLRKETPLIQIIDRPILPLKITKIGKVKSSIIGGLIGLILILSFLSIKRAIKNNLN